MLYSVTVELLNMILCSDEGMDNHTVMAVQSLLESQNVHETIQGLYSSFLNVYFNFVEEKVFLYF